MFVELGKRVGSVREMDEGASSSWGKWKEGGGLGRDRV